MAIYSLNASVIKRSEGHSATAGAAYRARCMILDERTGQHHDYSRMQNGALFTGIYAPKDAPAWSSDREKLWNTVEKGEKRKDAQVARDSKIALPHELTIEQDRWLVQDFVRENFTRKGYAADVAIHAPDAHGDDRNIHAHIMVTMRTLGPEGFAATKDRAMNGKEQLEAVRLSWEQLANRHLERHGHHEARIDRRTLKAQGIERKAGLHMGKDATAAMRRGSTTERGERQQAIEIHNRQIDALLEELAALQQQDKAASSGDDAMPRKWYDQAFDSATTAAAWPLAFLMGDPVEFRTPTSGEEHTTQINISIQPAETANEQAQAMKPAAPVQEVAPQPDAAPERQPEQAPDSYKFADLAAQQLEKQRFQEERLQERMAFEKDFLERQEQEERREREQVYRYS